MTQASRKRSSGRARSTSATPADDAEFFRTNWVLARYTSWRADVEGAAGRARPSIEEVEAAARSQVDFHRQYGDAGSQAFILARCRDFHTMGAAVPLALQSLLLDLAEAAAPVRRRGRQAAGILERELWRTHADLIQDQVDRGMTLEEAAERVHEWPATAGAKSSSTLLNHYDWARRAQKVKASKPK